MYSPPTHNVVIAGNTLGATALIQSGILTLAGGSNVTLSQAGNAITFLGGAGGGGGAPTLSLWENIVPAQNTNVSGLNAGGSGATTPSLVLQNTSHQTLMVFPLAPQAGGWAFPGNMTFTGRCFLDCFCDFTSNPTVNIRYSLSAGLYTLMTGSGITGISLLAKASNSFSVLAGTDATANLNGPRFWTLDASQWTLSTGPAITQTLTGLQFSYGSLYFLGLVLASSGQAMPLSLMGANWHQEITRSGFLGQAAPLAPNTTQGWIPYTGIYTNALSMPASLQATDLNHVAPGAAFVPHLAFNNLLTLY
jgi:hypothetical protein